MKENDEEEESTPNKNLRDAAEHRQNLEQMLKIQSRVGNKIEDSDMVKMAKIMMQT